MSSFEENINRLSELSQELKDRTREAHEVLKEIKRERKEIDRRLGSDIKEMIQERVDDVVKSELDELGPEIRKQTNLIYDRVGDQIDKLITLSLGNEFGSRKRSDLRPLLAAKLREWLLEIVNEEETNE